MPRAQGQEHLTTKAKGESTLKKIEEKNTEKKAPRLLLYWRIQLCPPVMRTSGLGGAWANQVIPPLVRGLTDLEGHHLPSHR